MKLMPIHKNIKELRKSKNITQDKFSKLFDIKRSNVSNFETGVSKPSIELSIRIAGYFGVTLDYLWIGKQQDFFNTGNINTSLSSKVSQSIGGDLELKKENALLRKELSKAKDKIIELYEQLHSS